MPFERLGLRDDASERDVRRAYAVLLKKTRPDDDPVAFQALHEAYRECLEELRYRRENAYAFDEEDQGDEPTRWEAPAPRIEPGEAPAGEVDSDYAPVNAEANAGALSEADQGAGSGTALDESEGFNLTAFLEDLYEQCDTATPAGLEAWLNQQPALYSISLKSLLTVPVLRAVVAREPALRPPMLDAVANFFGASQLGRQDWWLVEQLEQAKARAVAIDQFSAGRMPRANPQEQLREFDAVIERRIASRRWRWTSLLLMLMPGVPSRINARINEIDHLTEGASLDLVDPRLRRIAATLADRTRVPWQRMALTWARAMSVGLPLVLYLSLVNDAFTPRPLLGVAIVALAFTAWQLAMAGYLAAQRAIARRGLGHRWREILAGSLLALALAAGLVPGLPLWVGVMLALVGSFIAATAQRFQAWFVLTLCSGAAVTFFSTLDLSLLPLPPALLATSFPGVLALLVDRVESRLTGRTVDEVAGNHRWLLIAGAACAALAVLALVIVAAR